MKMSSKCALAALATFGITTVVSASNVTFVGGIRPGNFQGGEFVGTYDGGDLGGKVLRSFCLERNEYINLDGNNPTPTVYTYTVNSLQDGAIQGGIGGGTGGPPTADPVSVATAWIFKQWMTGAITNDAASARIVQFAIWVIEDEFDEGIDDTEFNLDAYAVDVQALIDDANAAVSSGNLTLANFSNLLVVNPEEGSTHRQSQIVMIPLPTASGMALAGLALVGGIRRRK